MRGGDWLLVGGVALLAYNAYQKSTFATTVNIVFRGVKIENLNTIKIELAIQNVTNAPIDFRSMAGTLYLNGNAIANLSNFNSVRINSNAETVLPITVRPDLGSIVANFQSLITKGNLLNFNVQGNVNIDGVPVLPFSLDKTMQVG